MTPQQRYYKKNKEAIKAKQRIKSKERAKKKRLTFERYGPNEDIRYSWHGRPYKATTQIWRDINNWQLDILRSMRRYDMFLEKHKASVENDAMILCFLFNSIYWYFNRGYYDRERHHTMDGIRFNCVWNCFDIVTYLKQFIPWINKYYIGALANCAGLYYGSCRFRDIGDLQDTMYRPITKEVFSDKMNEIHPMPFYNASYIGQHGMQKESVILKRALGSINAVREMNGRPDITLEDMETAKSKLEDVMTNKVVTLAKLKGQKGSVIDGL